MARPARPWRPRGRDIWYCWHHGKRVSLGKGLSEADAWRAMDRLKRGEPPADEPASLTTAELFERFIAWCRPRRKPLTVEFYERHCGGFCRYYGALPAALVRPHHVESWLDQHAWGQSTRSGAIASVKRMFRWAYRQGILDADWLKGIEKPSVRARTEVLDAVQVRLVYEAATDQCFRDLIALAWLTGARPSELVRIEARDVLAEQGVAVLRRHKTDRSGRARTIPLVEPALLICDRLAQRYPTGPLLRNTHGRPWRRNAITLRFRRLRDRLHLGRETTAGALRHRFTTDLLLSGVPIALVAEILGHQSTLMVSRHYSHLAQDYQPLRDAVRSARPFSSLI